jgi:sugar/nucleoside kinase (ribokinase family)
MKYDVVTIGGAVRDFTFYLELEKDSKSICFLPGTKINIKEAYFTTGGGACNVAVGLANFGFKVAVVIRVGKDHSGQAILERLKEKKVDTRFVQIDEKIHTGISLIIHPKGGERIILTYRGANDNLKITNPKTQIPNSNWIYIASLSGKNWEKLLNKIFSLKFKNLDLKIAWNPGILQIQKGKEKLARFLKNTEVLILNRYESAILSGKSEKNIPLILKSLYQLGPKILVITCGKDGAFVMDKDNIIYQPAHPTKVIDTTGAGDSFSSGFLAGLILFNNLKKALRLGILNSAANLNKIGAQEGLLTKKDLNTIELRAR